MEEDIRDPLVDFPADDDDEEQLLNLGDILEDGDDSGEPELMLPLHFRCACHTLNLVAASDSKAALKPRNSDYARVYFRIFGLLSKLWSKYNQSVLFADKVREKFSKVLITPSSTRWNSTFDAVKRVQELREEDRVAFGAILTTANLPSMSQLHVP